jgi:hypothetical protein
MTNTIEWKLADDNLTLILRELEAQPQIGKYYPPTAMSYGDQVAQIREFIDVGEYLLAYEYINGALEEFPYSISGKAAIKLLEVGLLMGFKSELERDRIFDRRPSRR